ncbi:MAG: TrmH family RNA methyltransferase [Thermoflexales bacterium]|nr:TrmH family RNA methyltransferase [Thermoflexales bacterium]
MKLKRYKKEYDYSYTLGQYPTIELLKYKPEHVRQLVFHSKFSNSEGARVIDELMAGSDVAVEWNDRLVETLSPKKNCYVVGVFDKYYSSLDAGADHVVLVNPSDNGNLGTLLRTMLAFEVENLAIISPAVDVFSPEVIRASMGALFRVNVEYMDDIQVYRSEFDRPLFLFMTDGDQSLEEAAWQHPAGLVFGNESSGLPAEYRGLGRNVYLPQSDKVDSLNLAVAAGIVLSRRYTHVGAVREPPLQAI